MSAAVTDTADPPASRRSSWAVSREMFASPRRRYGFAITAAVVIVGYTILLPFDYTQRFSPANWRYLTAGMATWSVTLGLGLAFVLTVQVFAMRRVAAARTRSAAAGGLAFVASLLPSFLCCSPLVPTLLAVLGVSATGALGATGSLSVQYFFATHQTAFLAGSLILLIVTGWWGLRRVARAGCRDPAGCGTSCTPAASAERMGDHHG